MYVKDNGFWEITLKSVLSPLMITCKYGVIDEEAKKEETERGVGAEYQFPGRGSGRKK